MLLKLVVFIVIFTAAIIKKPTVIKQTNLTPVFFMKGAHHLVAEPIGQYNLLPTFPYVR